jgi:putative ABC transport system permease protein
MSVARLATRNLLRSPRRTVLTITAIVAGVGLFIVGEGFLSGMTEGILRAVIDGTSGHVLVRPRGYPTQIGQHPIDELLSISAEARALLDRRAVAWTERTLFAPIAAHGSDSLRVTAISYDPERDPRVFPTELWKVTGAMPEAHDEILISPRVARLLDLSPGGQLVLQVRTHKGAINALEVSVSGVLSTGNTALDMLTIFVPKPLAEELIATELPSHIAVRLGDRDDAEAFQAALGPLFPKEAEVVTWREETAEMIRLQEIRRRALDLVMFILMALAAFGIANTILMAAHERVREIGTLRAMGMTEGGVLGLFIFEGALMGIIGGLLGAAWGGALIAHWARSPIDFSEVAEKATKGLAASALLYTRFDLGVIASTIALGVIISVVASVYPARVASRMSPADAVRAS